MFTWQSHKFFFLPTEVFPDIKIWHRENTRQLFKIIHFSKFFFMLTAHENDYSICVENALQPRLLFTSSLKWAGSAGARLCWLLAAARPSSSGLHSHGAKRLSWCPQPCHLTERSSTSALYLWTSLPGPAHMSQLRAPLLCPELGSSLAIHMVLKVFTAWKGAIASVGSATVSEMDGCAFFLSKFKMSHDSSYHVKKADKKWGP